MLQEEKTWVGAFLGEKWNRAKQGKMWWKTISSTKESQTKQTNKNTHAPLFEIQTEYTRKTFFLFFHSTIDYNPISNLVNIQKRLPLYSEGKTWQWNHFSFFFLLGICNICPILHTYLQRMQGWYVPDIKKQDRGGRVILLQLYYLALFHLIGQKKKRPT